MAKDTEIIDLGSLVSELGTEAVIDKLNTKINKAKQDGYSEGYDRGRSDQERSYEQQEKLQRFGICFLIFLILAAIGYFFYSRIQRGYALDVAELEGCRAGNYATCLSGIERHGVYDTRSSMYKQIYLQATGKSLNKTEGIYSVEIDKTTQGQEYLTLKYNGKDIKVFQDSITINESDK